MLKLMVTPIIDGMDHSLMICSCKQTSRLLQNFGYFGVSYSVTQYFIRAACNKMCSCLNEHVNMYDIHRSLTCNE